MKLPDSNVAGIGLRAPHYRDLQAQQPVLGFLEVHSENFFGDGGQPLAYLDWFADRYAISTHGVGLSLGSTDPLDKIHLQKLKRLVDRIQPGLVSDHLCWVGVNGHFTNDLLPLPYTDDALVHVTARIAEVQDYLQRTILVENVSSYMQFSQSTIPEWEFVAALSRASGCKILLDVNNIYVNSVNHVFDPYDYLNAIPLGSVGEIHLAGFQDTGEILIDTHGDVVAEDVWTLYEYAINRFGAIPTLVEWDTDIPAVDVLLNQAARATDILRRRSR